MTTSYPGGIDSFTDPTSSNNLSDPTVQHSTQHAQSNDAIHAIENTLGINPQGSYADVATRLNSTAATAIISPAAGASADAVGGITDGMQQRTWLEFNATGAPTALAQAILQGAGVAFAASVDSSPDYSLALSTTDAYKLMEWTPDGRLAQWVVDSIRSGMRYGYGADPSVVITVAQDGSGQFTDVKSAVASIPTDASRPPYVVLVYPGSYETIDLVAHPAGDTLIVPDRVTVRGTNRDAVILHGECPTGTASNVVQASPAVDLSKNGALENLTIIGNNTRYPVHSESAGNFPNAMQRTKNVKVITTSSGTAWGCGTSSGNVQRHTGTVFNAIGGNSAFTCHNNLAFANPIEFIFDKCSFIAPIGYMKMQSLGAGQPGVVMMTGCDLSVSAVQYDDTPWMPTTAAGQYADHVEIELWADGKQLVAHSSIARGQALRIDSGTTTGDAVSVSGTAASILMGANPKSVLGGGGLTSYLVGYWDMSGILVGANSSTAVSNTLGTRLGDCSVTNKTLTVTVGTSTPVTVTFNTNLTAASNATILSQINTALGSYAAASLYDVAGNEHYPQFTDRQQNAFNNGAVGLPRWSVVGYAADGTVTPMTATTPLAGVALDQIPPSGAGRILRMGALYTATQALGLAAATVTAGTPIYLGAGATFSTTGTLQIATGSASGLITFTGAGA